MAHNTKEKRRPKDCQKDHGQGYKANSRGEIPRIPSRETSDENRKGP
jgi:hypothetical protein